MFALGLRYLMGWAMAAVDGANKQQPEWPPHPDRLFMALAAGWFDTGEDAAEGDALRWLERQPPPAIAASDAEMRRVGGGERQPVSYVPVNDVSRERRLPGDVGLDKLRSAGLALLPEHRARQPRSFPLVVPHRPEVHFVWADSDPGPHRAALQRLAEKVTYLGHSASLVQVWVDDQPPRPVWQVANGLAPHRLRIFGPGRLDYLKARMNRDNVIAHADLTARVRELKERERQTRGEEKRMLKDERVRLEKELETRFGREIPVSQRPESGLWCGYGRVREEHTAAPRGTIFDPNLIVLAFRGRRYPLASTLKLTAVLRGALLKGCPEPIPEWLSGHAGRSTAPTRLPHIALLPLAFVGAEHADGRLMGVAIALPRGVSADEVARCLDRTLHDPTTGVPRRIRLFDGRWLETEAVLETSEVVPATLRPERWTRMSRVWASVTPVVLDRHFDGPDRWEQAAEGVKDSCERVGLPRPARVVLGPVSLVRGVPHAREFPAIDRKGGGGRLQHMHAVLEFEHPVVGPVVVGAGRFRGYGLCCPADDGRSHG
jgi:CRISPR-associated protein Csb2